MMFRAGVASSDFAGKVQVDPWDIIPAIFELLNHCHLSHISTYRQEDITDQHNKIIFLESSENDK